MAARRKTRTTRRRRSPKPMLNVANAAQTLIVANAATTAFFGTNIQSFLLDGWARPRTSQTDNSWELSMAEIVKGIIPGGESFGQSGNVSHGWTNDVNGVVNAVKYNLAKPRGQQALATMVFTPIAFKVGKKILAKPLINPLNRGIKQLGLSSVLKV